MLAKPKYTLLLIIVAFSLFISSFIIQTPITRAIFISDQVNSCDSTSDWTGTMCTPAIDTSDKQEGSGSIYGSSIQSWPGHKLTYNPSGSWNWTDKTIIKFWFKCKDVTLQATIDIYMPDTNNHIYRDFQKDLSDNETWKELSYDISSPYIGWTVVGSPNKENVDSIQFRYWHMYDETKWMKIDDIRVGYYVPEMILYDDFETGDLSVWTGNYAHPSAYLSVLNSPSWAYNPSCYLNASIKNTGEYAYVYKSVSSTDYLSCRAYIYFKDRDFSVLNQRRLIGPRFNTTHSNSTIFAMASVVLEKTSLGNFYWGIYAYVNRSWTEFWSDKQAVNNQWQAIELRVKIHNCQGELKLLVNDTEAISKTGQDTNDLGNITSVSLGCRIDGTSESSNRIFLWDSVKIVNHGIVGLQTNIFYKNTTKYYDNRKAVVVTAWDDLTSWNQQWFDCVNTLKEKHIYGSCGIITDHGTINWTFIQDLIDTNEYFELTSHSRHHVTTPYNNTEEIGMSKMDITGNLTMKSLWIYGNNKYVYAYIEPYGANPYGNDILGQYHYLVSRSVFQTSETDFSTWDSENKTYNRCTTSQDLGNPDCNNVTFLNNLFETAWNTNRIYFIWGHPFWVNWSSNAPIPQHLEYINDNSTVWYVSLGLMYLYHYFDSQKPQSIYAVENNETGYATFKINITSTTHNDYGCKYPITYDFSIPNDWNGNDYVYYKYSLSDAWSLMDNKSSGDLFNGIAASRFDYANHRVYVSIGFGPTDDIYIRITNTTIPTHVLNMNLTSTTLPYNATAVYPQGPRDSRPGWHINLTATAQNRGEFNETFTVTAHYDNGTIGTQTVTDLPPRENITLTFTWNLTGVAPCRYNYTGRYYLPYAISVNVSSPTLGQTTWYDGAVTVRFPGDGTGDGRADIFDLVLLGMNWYKSYPGYDWRADWTGDGNADIFDLVLLGMNWYKQAQPA